MNKMEIIIYYRDIEEINILELLLGIEEEGVIFKILKINREESLYELAKEASIISNLSLGIAIDRDEIYVNIRNLDKRSLFHKINYSINDLRDYGINSARYVKGIPFKINN